MYIFLPIFILFYNISWPNLAILLIMWYSISSSRRDPKLVYHVNCVLHKSTIENRWKPISFYRCAKRAREKEFRYFGLQFYGECWSGKHSERLFASKKSSECLGYDYKTCEDSTDSACTGNGGHNYVYEIVHEGNSCIPVAHMQI